MGHETPQDDYAYWAKKGFHAHRDTKNCAYWNRYYYEMSCI